MKRTAKSSAVKASKSGTQQKGRQSGSDTSRSAAKSNNQQSFRQSGQGIRSEQGGQREVSRQPGAQSKGSDSHRRTRPAAER